jgi:hypothetical protein
MDVPSPGRRIQSGSRGSDLLVVNSTSEGGPNVRTTAAEQDRQQERIHRALEEAVRYGREGRTILGYALLRQGLAGDAATEECAETPGSRDLWANALAEFEREFPARWYRSLKAHRGTGVESPARSER